MVVRAAPERPAVFSIALGDREVVDARDAPAHVAERIELPVLVAVRAEPVPRIVVPFVRKAYRDAVVVKRPQLLDEAVVELLAPLAYQELLDGLAPGEELRAIPPDAVTGVSQRDPLRLARVPRVLGHAHLLRRRRCVEWRERRSRCFTRHASVLRSPRDGG